MRNTDQELIGILKDAVYDVNLRELGNISAETKLSELGLDSVAIMEMIGILEENLNIRIKDEAVTTLNSVGDLLNLIRSLLHAIALLRQPKSQSN